MAFCLPVDCSFMNIECPVSDSFRKTLICTSTYTKVKVFCTTTYERNTKKIDRCAVDFHKDRISCRAAQKIFSTSRADMIIKSIINHKGGVGKTTTTLNLGKGLAMKGRRVLIVDIDPQANLSQSVGIEDPDESIYHTFFADKPLPVIKLSENLDIVPSDLDLTMAENKLQSLQIKGYLALKTALEHVKSRYDYILIDCPPSLGILTNNALLASTDVMIVLQSQYLPTKGMDTIMAAVDSARGLNPNLKVSGILITQTDHTVMSKNIIDAVREAYGVLVYQSMIRRNVAIVEASSQRQDIFTYDSRSAAAEDYKLLTQEMLEKHGSQK